MKKVILITIICLLLLTGCQQQTNNKTNIIWAEHKTGDHSWEARAFNNWANAYAYCQAKNLTCEYHPN